MSEFSIRAQPIVGLPDSVEVVIEGGVDAANARLLKERLDKVISRTTTFVLIHMRNVSFINSSGLGYLMDLAAGAEKRGGTVAMVEVQPKVKVVLSNLGMARYFRMEASDEEARGHLRAQSERLARSPRLVPLDGEDEGLVFPVVGTSIRIGSDPKCLIRIRHKRVEPRHCEVYRTGDLCHVRDLGSRFGTFVGDRKVNDESLRAGDVIKIGTFRVAYYPPGSRAGAGS